MFKILIIVFLLTLSACTGGNLEKNLEAGDKAFGKCDNPNRHMSKIEYQICKDKELTQNNSEPFSLTDLINKVNSGNSSTSSNYPYSPILWKASLETLSDYSLKISDSQGGYIETDWIYDSTEPNKRCIIKIQITEIEVSSTGVLSKLVCESRPSGESIWYPDNIDYIEESQKITLSVLRNTQNYLPN